LVIWFDPPAGKQYPELTGGVYSTSFRRIESQIVFRMGKPIFPKKEEQQWNIKKSRVPQCETEGTL